MNPPGPTDNPTFPPARPPRTERFGLGHLMLLVAGLAFGCWMIVDDVRKGGGGGGATRFQYGLLIPVGLLGGLSLVGVPLLLVMRRKKRPPWGPGRLIWFSTGMSAWLLWPPVVVKRVGGGTFGQTDGGVCFAYGTPLMAIYVLAALLAGGWFRKRGRRRIARSWAEAFGLALGAAWACTGLYVLSIIYAEEF